MFRLFTGIRLPPHLRQQLHVLQEGIAGVGVDTRLTPPEDFHITLCFIGNVDAAAASTVDEALSGIRAGRFSLTVKGTGYFSGGRGPSHLWAGLAPSDGLQRLKEKIDHALEKHQVPFEKRGKYTPHITIARLKHGAEEKAAAFMQQHNLFAAEPFDVDDFILYRSHPGEEGPRYEEIGVYPLLTRSPLSP
jgi:2'-5' RNA ligase